jgi:hypothetical protein
MLVLMGGAPAGIEKEKERLIYAKYAVKAYSKYQQKYQQNLWLRRRTIVAVEAS